MDLLLFSDRDHPLARGLKGHQHRVVTVRPRPRGPSDLSYEPGRETFEDVRRRFPTGFKPDAVILNNLEYENFLWGLQDSEAPVFALISDSNLCFEVLRCGLGFVDVFLCNEVKQRDLFLNLGAHAVYLPWFSLDSKVFYPRAEEPRYDVVFVGNLNPYIHRRRGKLLEKLLSAPERFETRVLTNLHGEAYARALSRGRIVFNHAIRGELNMRVFEALGLRRLLLIEESNTETLRNFKEGEHLVTYNESSLIETVDRYLRNPGERERIAASGHEEAMANHSEGKRAEDLAQAIKLFIEYPPPRRLKPPLDSLHRGAARILLQQGQHEGAIQHASEALRLSDCPANRANYARILGSVAFFSPDRRSSLLGEFGLASEKDRGAREARAESAFSIFNPLELDHLLGKADPGKVRSFIDDLQQGRIEIIPGDGPLPIVYDPFRVAWEETLYLEFASEAERIRTQQELLLSRAQEMLGDEERRKGRSLYSLEAYGESQRHRRNGYVLQKRGSVEAGLGRFDEARQSFAAAFEEEPFFLGARRDLASVELQIGQREAAQRIAEESLNLLVEPFSHFEGGFMEVLDHAAASKEIEPYKGSSPVFWEGIFFNASGYARETSLLVNELIGRGLPLTIRDVGCQGQRVAMDAEVFKRLDKARGEPGKNHIQVFHFFGPQHFKKHTDAFATVIRTTYETDRVPREWMPALKAVDRVWVMTEFNREVFAREGIPIERIAVIPSPLGEFPLLPPEPLELLNTTASKVGWAA